MLRPIATITWTLLLFPCAATAAIWIWSYSRLDRWWDVKSSVVHSYICKNPGDLRKAHFYPVKYRYEEIIIGFKGCAYFERRDRCAMTPLDWQAFAYVRGWEENDNLIPPTRLAKFGFVPDTVWGFLGIAYFHVDPEVDLWLPRATGSVIAHEGYDVVRVPFWTLFLMSAMLPAMPLARRCLRSYRQCRSRRRNLCVHCGYDLRAHQPGDKCPECGTPIPTCAVDRPSSPPYPRH